MKVKILLVDDLKDNLLALDGLLKRDDVEISQARSGSDALEFMLHNDYALALIDVQMPGMSGFELAEFMRGAKRTKNIPIIFVTATANHQSFAFKGYESGAVDFLLKPLDTHAVKSKVNIFIELYRQKNVLKDQLATITELMGALSRSKDEAEQANAFKSQFLANMSHEIRTPLTAIMGFTDLLLDPAVPEVERREFANVVRRNGRLLTQLIDDILDLSKVEAGKLVTERIPCSLPGILAEVVSLLGQQAREKGIYLRVFSEGEVPEKIATDPVRLKQILINIAGNAVKFTAKGGVDVTVKLLEPSAGSAAKIEFSVSDTGPGICPEHQKRLFQPFTQADSSTTRMFGGSGLGLALARRLAQALGGDVVLTKSATGSGSTFTVTIETLLAEGSYQIGSSKLLEASEEALWIVGVRTRLTGIKILLVEDAPDNQVLISKILRSSGARVVLAENGEEAIQKAMEDDCDIVLMDLQMPVCDGFKATAELRRRGFRKPILALSAAAMGEDRDRALKVGCNEHLTKPISMRVLVGKVSEYAGKGGEVQH